MENRKEKEIRKLEGRIIGIIGMLEGEQTRWKQYINNGISQEDDFQNKVHVFQNNRAY